MLDNMFIMGLVDWMGDEHCYAQLIWSIRFMLVMGSQLKMEIMRVEDLVQPLSLLSFVTAKTDDAF